MDLTPVAEDTSIQGEMAKTPEARTQGVLEGQLTHPSRPTPTPLSFGETQSGPMRQFLSVSTTDGRNVPPEHCHIVPDIEFDYGFAAETRGQQISEPVFEGSSTHLQESHIFDPYQVFLGVLERHGSTNATNMQNYGDCTTMEALANDLTGSGTDFDGTAEFVDFDMLDFHTGQS